MQPAHQRLKGRADAANLLVQLSEDARTELNRLQRDPKGFASVGIDILAALKDHDRNVFVIEALQLNVNIRHTLIDALAHAHMVEHANQEMPTLAGVLRAPHGLLSASVSVGGKAVIAVEPAHGRQARPKMTIEEFNVASCVVDARETYRWLRPDPASGRAADPARAALYAVAAVEQLCEDPGMAAVLKAAPMSRDYLALAISQVPEALELLEANCEIHTVLSGSPEFCVSPTTLCV